MRLFSLRSDDAGLPPGTLIPVDTGGGREVTMSCIEYTGDAFVERAAITLSDLPEQGPGVRWINVNGLSDVGILEELGRRYGIGNLALEDILDTGQRPKIDDLDDHLLTVAKMWDIDPATGEIASEQVSFIMREGLLISFQERPGDVFDPIRDRIRKAKGRVRKMGADFLLYALLDAIVDRYSVVLESVGERIEALEESVQRGEDKGVSSEIHDVDKTVLLLRRSIWPLRDSVGGLARLGDALVSTDLSIYLRDLHDHTVESAELLEAYRDMINSLRVSHATSLSNRMNEVVKVLTMISTVFIPLSFIVGLYGMNFRHMPELEWRYGYPVVLCVLAIVSTSMLLFFRRRKWL